MSAAPEITAGFSIPDCVPSVGTPQASAKQDGTSFTRLALLGGSYGNLPALEACLHHARAGGCDGFAFLGDATGFCGHSDETVALIRRRFSVLVAGNYEQKAAARQEDCGCNYTDAGDNCYGSLAHQWAMQSLSETNRDWLGTWPNVVLLDTAIGRLLLCHGSPAQTNEFLYESQLDDAQLTRWLDQAGAIGLVCTHSGFPWVRRLPGGRFAANCGVVGKPDHDGDPAVHYAVLPLHPGASPHIARVEYDHTTWAAQLDEEGVDGIFTATLRDGIWTCGRRSLPVIERARGDRLVASLLPR